MASSPSSGISKSYLRVKNYLSTCKSFSLNNPQIINDDFHSSAMLRTHAVVYFEFNSYGPTSPLTRAIHADVPVFCTHRIPIKISYIPLADPKRHSHVFQKNVRTERTTNQQATIFSNPSQSIISQHIWYSQRNTSFTVPRLLLGPSTISLFLSPRLRNTRLPLIFLHSTSHLLASMQYTTIPTSSILFFESRSQIFHCPFLPLPPGPRLQRFSNRHHFFY